MESKLSRIFKNIRTLEPTGMLESKILLQIKLEREKMIRNKVRLSYAGLFVSLTALFYAAINYGSAFLQSEFWSVATLAFSDMGIVARHWNDYLFSLIETFPITTAIIMLAPVFVLLMSLNLYFNTINKHNHNYI